MKKIGMTILLILMVFLNGSFGVKEEEDIQTLMRTMEELDVNVTSWETVHLVHLSDTEMKQIASKLKAKYDIVKEVKNEAITYILHPKESLQLFHHSIRIVQYDGKNTLQFIVSGQKWNDEIERYYKAVTESLQSNDILQNVEPSTCVKVLDSAIIINGLLNDEFWSNLKVVNKSEQKELLQQSTYEKEIIGYTPMFNSEITVNDQAMNVQTVIKKVQKNKKELIIGTPVILNEY